MASPEQPSKIVAPFTPKQVEALNIYQVSGIFHEYTCTSPDKSILFAKDDGWHCKNCDYTQNWAFATMTDLELIDHQYQLTNHGRIMNLDLMRELVQQLINPDQIDKKI